MLKIRASFLSQVRPFCVEFVVWNLAPLGRLYVPSKRFLAGRSDYQADELASDLCLASAGAPPL